MKISKRLQKFVKISLAGALSACYLLTPFSADACTTVIIGRDVTENNAWLVSRTADSHIITDYVAFENRPHIENQTGTIKSLDNNFTRNLPAVSLAYSRVPVDIKGNMGETGINELGVGISSTETIFPSDKVLAIDPYVMDTGIDEATLLDVLLPQIHSAREGAMLLGEIIEQQGMAEGFGVAFADRNEVWYLETASGHHWMAAKMPADKCFATANQGRLRDYDPQDTENYMASPGLIDFAVKNGLFDPKQGPFDFHKAFMRDKPIDSRYNYPRVEVLNYCITGLNGPNVYTDGDRLPVFATPNHKISLSDLKNMLRQHYEGTPSDPYMACDSSATWRPISIFRTAITHILEIRPDLPKEIGCINYISVGFNLLSPFLPIYQGVETIIPEFSTPSNPNSHGYDDSAYWRLRRLQTLVMQDYPRYSPIVRQAYADFESDIAIRQQATEAQYMKLYQQDPQAAVTLLTKFENDILRDCLILTDKLTAQIVTLMAERVEKDYHYTAGDIKLDDLTNEKASQKTTSLDE